MDATSGSSCRTATPTAVRVASWIAACWLVHPALAAAGAPAVPGQGDRVVEDTGTDAPSSIAARPLRSMVWESIDPAATSNEVNSHTIYLHRCVGADCTVVQGNTNSTTNPVHSSLGHGVLSPFSQGDATWSAMVACMKDVYAPFNIEITEANPGTSPHFEIMIGGKPQELGMSAGIGGVSPFSCVPYIPNSVVFVFDVWGNNAEELCATAAQEIAHSFSLDHTTEPTDPMTYFAYKGRRHYVSGQVQCGSDCDKNHRSPLGASCVGTDYQEHACACGNGAQTQNEVQAISSLFGDGSATPPTVKIVSPTLGETVTAGFPISIEATDDVRVASTEVRLDGALIGSKAASPYAFTGPATLADGTHVIEVTAYDGAGTPGRARVEVIVGPGCKGPSDCGDAQTCVGGRCVAGPSVAGGMGASCAAATDCASWQCANDDGSKYCVESCSPGQCPANFGCRDDGQGGGVCWPGYDENGGGCAVDGGGMPLGTIGLGLGFAAFVLRRRRGDRPVRATPPVPA
jgi:hypothetical protein